MKRIVAYGVILVMLLAAPVEKLDVAKLEPVEVVYLYKEWDKVVLTTDTGAQGTGENALTALQDLKEKTPGVVYLDTAQYLLVAQDTLEQIHILRPELKDKIKLCMAQNVKPEEAAKYLGAHGKLPSLKQWEKGAKLPLWNGEKIIEKT